ncbi:MAG TPA: acyltransferase [Vicinamibacterales bacterium]|jgi:peptidoglycan/LPS O-acetylase OafA/YrhL
MPSTHGKLAPESQGDPGGAIAHVPALDGLRGLAILLVLMEHFGVVADLPHRIPFPGAAWIERIFYVGWSGVDLFFVLSGFLITSILLESRDQPNYYRRFYARRILRIFPLYYTVLILCLLVLPALFPSRATALLGQALGGQIWLWTYTLNIGMALGYIANAGILGQFWTLTIEEQFYFFWPWLVKTFSVRALVRICVLLSLGALGLRFWWLRSGDWAGAYRFTLTRVDALALGALAAILVRDAGWRRRLAQIAPAGLVGGLTILAVIFLKVPHFYSSEWIVVTAGHSIVAMTFVCALIIALREPAPRWLTSSVMRAIGKYSYGIYVWHWPFRQILLIGWYGPLTATASGVALADVAIFTIGGVGGSIFLGWASYHLLERRFLELKSHFRYEPRQGTSVSASVQPVP